MNRQTLFDSTLYQSKEVFDVAAVSRLYGIGKVTATELVQELLDEGLLSRHWRCSNNRWSLCFCRYTADTRLLRSDWNSRRYYKNIDMFQQSTPKWY